MPPNCLTGPPLPPYFLTFLYSIFLLLFFCVAPKDVGWFIKGIINLWKMSSKRHIWGCSAKVHISLALCWIFIFSHLVILCFRAQQSTCVWGCQWGAHAAPERTVGWVFSEGRLYLTSFISVSICVWHRNGLRHGLFLPSVFWFLTTVALEIKDKYSHPKVFVND